MNYYFDCSDKYDWTPDLRYTSSGVTGMLSFRKSRPRWGCPESSGTFIMNTTGLRTSVTLRPE